jgi:hypothetical protein
VPELPPLELLPLVPLEPEPLPADCFSIEVTRRKRMPLFS